MCHKCPKRFSKNDIKDKTKITNAFLPRIINKQLNKIFLEGKIEGAFMFLFLSEQILLGRKIDNIETQEQLG